MCINMSYIYIDIKMHTYPSKSNNLRRSKQFSNDPSPLLAEMFSVTMYLAISPLAFLAYTEDILPCYNNNENNNNNNNNNNSDGIYSDLFSHNISSNQSPCFFGIY
jgi:hypothetical protein